MFRRMQQQQLIQTKYNCLRQCSPQTNLFRWLLFRNLWFHFVEYDNVHEKNHYKADKGKFRPKLTFAAVFIFRVFGFTLNNELFWNIFQLAKRKKGKI